MYGYYCLQALKMCPKTFPAVLITLSQIAQMFVGTGVCCSAWYFTFFSKNSCHNDMSNLIAGALMYASYLYLFSEFAVKRYVGKSPSRTKPSDPKKLEWLRDDINRFLFIFLYTSTGKKMKDCSSDSVFCIQKSVKAYRNSIAEFNDLNLHNTFLEFLNANKPLKRFRAPIWYPKKKMFSFKIHATS